MRICSVSSPYLTTICKPFVSLARVVQKVFERIFEGIKDFLCHEKQKSPSSISPPPLEKPLERLLWEVKEQTQKEQKNYSVKLPEQIYPFVSEHLQEIQKALKDAGWNYFSHKQIQVSNLSEYLLNIRPVLL